MGASYRVLGPGGSVKPYKDKRAAKRYSDAQRNLTGQWHGVQIADLHAESGWALVYSSEPKEG